MRKVLGTTLIGLSVAAFMFAQVAPAAPEIDAGSAASALGIITGAVLLIRSRKT